MNQTFSELSNLFIFADLWALLRIGVLSWILGLNLLSYHIWTHLFPIDRLPPLHYAIRANLVDAGLNDESTWRHVRVKPLGGVSGHDGHGSRPETVGRKFQFESPFAFAVAVFQNEFSLFCPRNKASCGGRPVAVAGLGRVVEPERILSGLFGAFETLLPASTVAVVEDIGVVTFVGVVVLQIGSTWSASVQSY